MHFERRIRGRWLPLIALAGAGISTLVMHARGHAAEGGTITGTVDATPAKLLADTIVYVKNAPGTFAPKTEKMDQKGMKFIPEILIVTKGDTVEFMNHDAVAHNVYSPDQGGFNLGTFPAGQSHPHVFTGPTGAYTILCSIHPEMLGYIFEGQNPYAAVVDKNGSYTIHGVPPGTYQVAIWNPKLKAAEQSVTVAASGSAQANFSLKR